MKHSICEGDYINTFDAFVSKYKAKILTAKINNESLQPKGLYCKSDFFFHCTVLPFRNRVSL